MVVLRAARCVQPRSRSATSRAQVIGELVAQVFVLQTELDGRLEVAELRAAIVALAFERVRVDRLVGQQRRDAVRELDLAAGTAPDRLELARRSPGVST